MGKDQVNDELNLKHGQKYETKNGPGFPVTYFETAKGVKGFSWPIKDGQVAKAADHFLEQFPNIKFTPSL